MLAFGTDIAQRLRAEAVEFDPEQVEVGDLAQDLQVAFGLRVEVQVEQDVDIGTGQSRMTSRCLRRSLSALRSTLLAGSNGVRSRATRPAVLVYR